MSDKIADSAPFDSELTIDLSNAYPVENKQELLEKFGVIKNPTGLGMLRTKKQRKYVEGVVAGKKRRRAAIEAGYSEKVADTMGRINGPANNRNIQEAFKRIVQKVAPIDRLAKRVSEGLDAKETVFFQKDGAVTDQREVIAWGERRRYVELAARYGGFHEEKEQAAAPGTVIINWNGAPPEWAEKRVPGTRCQVSDEEEESPDTRHPTPNT